MLLNKNSFILLPFCILLMLKSFQSATSVNPIWISSPYFESSSSNIKTNILTILGSANPITYTTNFVKTYSQIPQLAYTVKNYRGNF